MRKLFVQEGILNRGSSISIAFCLFMMICACGNNSTVTPVDIPNPIDTVPAWKKTTLGQIVEGVNLNIEDMSELEMDEKLAIRVYVRLNWKYYADQYGNYPLKANLSQIYLNGLEYQGFAKKIVEPSNKNKTIEVTYFTNNDSLPTQGFEVKIANDTDSTFIPLKMYIRKDSTYTGPVFCATAAKSPSLMNPVSIDSSQFEYSLVRLYCKYTDTLNIWRARFVFSEDTSSFSYFPNELIGTGIIQGANILEANNTFQHKYCSVYTISRFEIDQYIDYIVFSKRVAARREEL